LPSLWDTISPSFSADLQHAAERAKSAEEYVTNEDLDSLVATHTDFGPHQQDPCGIADFNFPQLEGGVEDIIRLREQSMKGISDDADFAASLETTIRTLRADCEAQRLDKLEKDCLNQRSTQKNKFPREAAGHAAGMQHVLLTKHTRMEVDGMNAECRRAQYQKIQEERRFNDRSKAHEIAYQLMDDSMWKSKLESAKTLCTGILDVDSEAHVFQENINKARQFKSRAAKVVQHMEATKEDGENMIVLSQNHKNRVADELDDARDDCKQVFGAMLNCVRKFHNKNVENEAARMKVTWLRAKHDMHCHRLDEAKRQLQETERACDQWQKAAHEHKQVLCEKVASNARKCKDDARSASEEAALNCQLGYQLLKAIHGDLTSELAVVEDDLNMYIQNKQRIEEYLCEGGEDCDGDAEDLECELADLTDKEREQEDRRQKCWEFIEVINETLLSASTAWASLQALELLNDEGQLVDAASKEVAGLYKWKPHSSRTRKPASRQMTTSMMSGRGSSSSLAPWKGTDFHALIKQEALKIAEQMKADALRSATPSEHSPSEVGESWVHMTSSAMDD